MIEKTSIKKLMGANLSFMRTSAGMTATELAAATGCALSTISKAEHGITFGDDLLARLCNYFAVDPVKFFLPVEHGKVDGMSSYSVNVTDNSMVPRYQPGGIIYANPALPIKSGDYIFAVINGKQYIRRVYYFDSMTILTALHPEFSPISVTEKDTVTIHKITGYTED